MSLFNKKDAESADVIPAQHPDKPVKSAKTSGDVISSVISKDMRITGEVSFKGKARVDGTIEGNIKGEHLILSESGRVFGDLELTTLLCHGSIEGNVTAQQVTAHSNSSLAGNLVATSLTVEAGARLKGEVSSSQPQQTQQSRPKPAPVAAPPKAEPEKKDTTKN